MESKICRICSKTKKIDFFEKSKQYKNGISNKCKNCANEIYREKYDNKYREKKIESVKTYALNNKEKVTELNKNWKLKNPIKAFENNKRMHQKAIYYMSDYYIKNLLVNIGFKKEMITSELIELKRITLKTKRLCQQLKN